MTQKIKLKQDFQAIICEHAALFPHWGVDDLYKLVFQAAMGSEHAVSEPDAAYGRLKSEADALTHDKQLPLIMPVSPDHRLVRVGIQPYLAVGGDLRELAHAFVLTAQSFDSSQDRIARYWSWIEAMATDVVISMALPILQKYIEKRRSQGYPAVHHSAQYRRLYHPAYRVVLKDLVVLPVYEDL